MRKNSISLLIGLFMLLISGCSRRLPNIILVSIDTLRADHLSCYGYERHTSPILDSLASRGALFELCQAQAPWTLPSHATMFTGLTVRNHGTTLSGGNEKKLDPSLASLPVLLHDNGYRTAGFVNVRFLTEPFGFNTGFDHFVFDSENGWMAEYTVNSAVNWLREELDSQEEGEDIPLFMFIHLWDVHSPYNPPVPFANYFTDLTRETSCEWAMGEGDEVLNPEDKDFFIARYDGSISYVDHELGRLFSELRTLGISDNTLIIITADHGEEFFEHGGVSHGRTLFQEQLHVPLIIAGPGIAAGERRDIPCGLFDLFPTIVGQTDLAIPDSLDGIDLFSRDYNEERVIPSSGIRSDNILEFSQVALLKDRQKLIWGIHSETGMQFDLNSDPGETHPLPILRTLVSAAEFYWCTPPRGNPETLIDDAVRQELIDLGYIR